MFLDLGKNNAFATSVSMNTHHQQRRHCSTKVYDKVSKAEGSERDNEY
jgi:hypothetical protein